MITRLIYLFLDHGDQHPYARQHHKTGESIGMREKQAHSNIALIVAISPPGYHRPVLALSSGPMDRWGGSKPGAAAGTVGAAALQRRPGVSSGLGHGTEAPYRAVAENFEPELIPLFVTSESFARDGRGNEVCFQSATSGFEAYRPSLVMR